MGELRRCVATDDIYNEFGVLLIKKGDQISPKTAEHMARHRLDRDIDEAVDLEHPLSGEALYDAFMDHIRRHSDLQALQEQQGQVDLLRYLCLGRPFGRLPMQQLSVLQAQLPEVFDHTLLGAWLTGLVAHASKWPKDRVLQAFGGALFRDLGLLHIDPLLVNKCAHAAQDLTVELTTQECRALAVHPLVSRKILATNGGFGEEALQAVTEHQELPSGIGYPLGKDGDSLTEMGRLLSMSHVLCRLRAIGGNLHATLPYLRMLESVHPHPLYRTTYLLLNAVPFDPEPVGPEDVTQVAENTIELMVSSGAAFASLVALQNQMAQLVLDKAGKYLLQKIQRTIGLLQTSGLASVDFICLLDELKQDKALDELSNTALIQREFFCIAEHIRRLGNAWLNDDEKRGDTPSKGETSTTVRELIASNLKLMSTHFNDQDFLGPYRGP